MAQKKGCIPWNKGISPTKETIKKMRLVSLGRTPWNKGKKLSESHREKCGLANFKGDKAKPDAGRKRAQNAFKEIQPCKLCGVLDERPRMMIRHHIDHNTLNNFPSNVEFLCRKCHINEHREELLRARGLTQKL